MKPSITRGCLFVLLAVFTLPLQAQTIFQNVLRKPTFHNLHKIGYATTTTMYAIGDGAAFVSTTDGGTTINTVQVSSGYERLYGIDFATPQTGAVCGEHGLYAVTTNAGATWTAGHIAGASSLVGIGFNIATLSGFAVEDSGKIFYTSNLGANWNLVLDGSTFPIPINFSSVSRISATAFGALTTYGYFYRSTDNGKSWDSLGHAGTGQSNGMYFSDALHGWVVGAGFDAYTVDGGSTWTTESVGNSLYNLYGVSFTDPSHGWTLYVTGNNTDVLKCSDGKTFDVSTDTSVGAKGDQLRDIRFDAADSIGWVVGDAGDIWMTSNGGKKWKELSSGAPGNTDASSFFDDQTGVFSTDELGSGYNYYTSDAGATWSKVSVGENKSLAIYMISQTSALSLIRDATKYLQYTTNSGKTWGGSKATPAYTSNQYNRVLPTGTNTIYACGQLGAVSFTTDGGATWNDADLNGDVQGDPCLGGAFFDAKTGYVCGNGGMLAHTTDAGVTWTQIKNLPFDINFDLTDMAFASQSNGWIVTDSLAAAMHTTNGGTTWNIVDIGATDTLTRVVFADALHGWMGGVHGQLFQTLDGGTTWKKIPTGTSNPIDQISYTPRTSPHTLWISGGLGMILKGDLTKVGVEESHSAAQPGALALGAAYPNPFSIAGSHTSIAFTINTPATAQLAVINMLGETVRTISSAVYGAGEYTAIWDGRDARGNVVPAGAYFFTLASGGVRATKSIIVTH